MANNNTSGEQKSTRGFASMDPAQQKEIASRGGKAAHEKGTAHQFNSQEAAEAGAKGGKASHSKSNTSNETRGGDTRTDTITNLRSDDRFIDED